MKRIILCACVLAGMASIAAGQPYMPGTILGNVKTVGPRCRYATIGAAMTAASAGDVILVTPGTYAEQVIMKDGTTLIGWAPGAGNDDATDGTTAQINPGATVITYAASAKPVLGYANNCVIKNISLVSGSATLSGWAASIAGTADVANVLFENCYLFGQGDIIRSRVQASATVKNVTNLVMRNCYLAGGYDGILVAGDAKFYSCQIRLNNLWLRNSADHRTAAICPDGVLAADFYDCDIYVYNGGTASGRHAWGYLARPAAEQADVINFYNCIMRVVNGDTESLCTARGIQSDDNGIIRFYGGSVSTDDGTGAGAVDLYATDGGTIYAHGVKFSTSAGTIHGSVAWDDDKLGFFGAVPSVRSADWAITNWTSDKVLNCDSTSDAELADVLSTLIKELSDKGLISGTVAAP